MPPLRANSPVDNDFSVLNVPTEESPVDQLPKDVKDLAKEANSASGSIILTHLQNQIDTQKAVMFGTQLDKMSTEEIGQQTRASMKVIAILDTVIRDCETAVKAVKDATDTSKTV